MKNLAILLLVLPCLVMSQEIFQKEISYTYTLSFSEIIKLPDNGYLGCGYTKTDAIDSTHAIIARMDSLMQVQWCKRYIIMARDDFRCIEALSDGNFLVGGTGRSEWSTFYGATMFKIDGSGNVIWHKLYSNVYDDAAMGVFEQSDNTLVLFVRYGVNAQPSKILKTDATGNLISEIELYTENVFPGILFDCVTADGTGYYFVGGHAMNSATGKNMFYIMKTSDDEVIWYNEYDFGRNVAFLYSIIVLSDGNIAVSGYVTDAVNTDIANIAVMKIEPTSGSVIWSKEIRQVDDYYEIGASIGSLQDNEIMVCGRANTTLGYQAVAIKLSENGEIVWSHEYGEGPYESLAFLNEVSGNRYLFGGRMSLADGPYFIQTDANGYSACLTTEFDFIVNELTAVVYSPQVTTEDPNVEPMSPPFEESSLTISEEIICTGTVNVEDKPTLRTAFNIYPNPASKYVFVETVMDDKIGLSIEIFNIQGELVHRSIMQNQKKEIKTSFAPGVYFITLRNNEEHSYYHKKFIISK